MLELDTVIAYTDGSHIGKQNSLINSGTGAGIHAYGSPVPISELIEKHHPKSGLDYIHVKELPECVGVNGYEKIAQKKIKVPAVSINDLGLTLLEGTVSIRPKTSQVGELQAFISLVKADFVCKRLIIHTDSNYLKQGILEWMDGWKKRGWIRSDGTAVENLDLWKTIYNLWHDLKANGVEVTLLKIKGHSDRYGNEMADALARIASDRSANINTTQEGDYGEEWSIEPYVYNKDDSTIEDVVGGAKKPTEDTKPKKPKKIKDEDKHLPLMLRQKFLYTLGGTEIEKVSLDGEEFYRFYGGDHAKLKDDRLLAGKAQPDTIGYLTLLKDDVPVVKELNKEMHFRMWENVPIMYRLNLVNILNGTFISQNKFNLRFWDKLDFTDLTFNSNFNELYFDEKNWLAVAVKPPMLSYRQMDYFDMLTGWMTKVIDGSYEKDDRYSVEDITDHFFDENGKPTNRYRKIDKFYKVDVTAPITGKKVKVILPRNIAIPDVTYLNKLQKENLRVKLCARYESDNAFRSFLVLETDIGYQMVISYHSSLRIYE